MEINVLSAAVAVAHESLLMAVLACERAWRDAGELPRYSDAWWTLLLANTRS